MWSWSYSQEGVCNIRARIEAQPVEWLREVWAEWQAAKVNRDQPWQEPEFSERRYRKALKQAEEFSADILADEVFSRAEEQADCTNGAWEAYCCPFHCGPHTVTPDPVEDEEVLP
jgi:hypothetical protein